MDQVGQANEGEAGLVGLRQADGAHGLTGQAPWCHVGRRAHQPFSGEARGHFDLKLFNF